MAAGPVETSATTRRRRSDDASSRGLRHVLHADVHRKDHVGQPKIGQHDHDGYPAEARRETEGGGKYAALQLKITRQA